jgi:hypothetical protein
MLRVSTMVCWLIAANWAANEHNFGIITHDLQPKPAYTALQHLTAQLGARGAKP